MVAKILSIKKKKVKDIFYNIEVENDNSFVLENGFVLKNCGILDGSIWPPGSQLSDHPLGMCVFVPKMKTLQEMGFDLSKIPLKYLNALQNQSEGFPTWKEKMLSMPDEDLMEMFGNKSLFDLWKAERFALEFLVVKRQGFFVPTTFKEMSARLAEGRIPTVSNPAAKVRDVRESRTLGKNQSKEYMRKVDMYDNHKNSNVMFREHFPRGVNPETLNVASRHGGNGFGLGEVESVLIRKRNPELWGRINDILVRYSDDVDKMPWHVRNELMRLKGMFKRWTADGGVYWVLDDGQLVELRRSL